MCSVPWSIASSYNLYKSSYQVLNIPQSFLGPRLRNKGPLFRGRIFATLYIPTSVSIGVRDSGLGFQEVPISDGLVSIPPA